MNWLIRLGQWWEGRRIVRKPDLEAAKDELRKIFHAWQAEWPKLEQRIALSPTAIKELALINARINQLELYVGLKREPKPEHVPGAAKIS